MAGRLQGFMPGDLGSVGPASLSLRRLDTILTVVLEELEKMLGEASSSSSHLKPPQASSLQQQQHHVRVKHHTKNSRVMIWQPLSHRQRRHLELSARLLACAQRMYWTKQAFDAMPDPTQSLTDEHFGQVMASQQGGGGSHDGAMDVPPLVSSSSSKRSKERIMANLKDLTESPWVKHVVQPLVTLLPMESLTFSNNQRASTNLERGKEEIFPSVVSAQANILVGTSIQDYPLLQHLYELKQQQQGQHRDSVNVKAIGSLISIIAACAEAFPSGGCWASFQSDYWWTISVHDLKASRHHNDTASPKTTDLLEDDELQVIGCSTHDLSLVLFLLSCMLEMQGRQHADTCIELQHIVLLGLIKLAHCTAVIHHRSRQQEDLDLTSIETVWRHVWNILFRSDLRYASYTQDAEPGPSTGELVLILLHEMVRLHCTDLNYHRSVKRVTNKSTTTFLSSNQASVWNLPVFRDANKVESATSFLLLCTMLQNAGLSNIGADGIDDTWIKKSPEESSMAAEDVLERNWRQFGRRSRLISFCMGCLSRLPQLGASDSEGSGKLRHLFGPLAASIAALVHGQGMLLQSFKTLFDVDSDVFSPDRIDLLFKISFTTIPMRADEREPPVSCEPELYDALWRLPTMFLAKSPRLIDNSDQVDNVQRTVLCLRHIHDSNAPKDHYVDFVSPRDAEVLHKFLRAFLFDFIWPQVNDVVVDNEHLDPQLLENGSISCRTLTLKVILTVCFSCRKDQVPDEVDKVSGIIAATLQTMLSNIHQLSAFKGELTAVLTDLLQTFRALASTALSSSVRYSKAVIKASHALADKCKALLLNYAKVRRNGINCQEAQGVSNQTGVKAYSIDMDEDEMRTTKSRRETENDSLSSDADSDKNIGLKRPRKRGESLSHKRRRIIELDSSEALTMVPLDALSASRVGLILITLRPSFTHCKLIAECMLGTQFNSSTDGLADEVDYQSLIFCFGMLCSQRVILHNEVIQALREADSASYEAGKDAILSLCFDVIRQARHESDPSSLFHLIGFDVCAELTQQRENDVRIDPINKRLAKVLTGLIGAGNHKNEIRSLKRRPSIRASWLQAATTVFKFGRENIHSVFDQDFRKYLLSSLRDLSATVRSSASLAVGAAVLVLPEQHKIYKRVLDELPPVVSFSSDVGFRKWLSQADIGAKADSSTAENTVWEDSFLSLRFESMVCLAMIAGATSEYSIFREILFNLMRQSFLHPVVEPLAFRACCKIASMRHYESCEAMLHVECEGLIQKWLDEGEELSKMPLLLSDPSLLRRLMADNLGPMISFSPADQGVLNTKLDFQALKEEATANFLYKYREVVFPLAYIQAHKHLPTAIDQATAVKVGVEQKERYIREVCYILVGNDPSFEVARRQMLRKHIQDILASCFPLMLSNDDNAKRIGSGAFNALKTEVARETFERFSKNDAHLAVRSLLELAGKFEHQIGLFSQSQQCYSNALHALMKELVGETNKRGDIFGVVGCSATEYLLYAMSGLDKASLAIQKTQLWTSIDIICEIVCTQLRHGDYEGIQLGFCLSFIVQVLMRPRLKCIQHVVLQTLMNMLSEVQRANKSDVLKKEISFVLRKIVAVCLVVHERGQTTFLSRCKQQYLESEVRTQGCLGFLLLTDNTERTEIESNGIWGWDEGSSDDSIMKLAVSKHGAFVDTQIVDCIVTTYEVLDIVAKLVDSMGLSGIGFLNSGLLPTVKASQISILAELNEQFCAQNILAQLFEDKKRASTSGVAEMMFLGISEAIENEKHSLLSSLVLRVDDAELFDDNVSSSGALNGLTPEQRLMWIELTQLALHLQQHPNDGANNSELSNLVKELIGLCAAPYPEPLRCGASRCLAEVDPNVLLGFSTDLLDSYRDKNAKKPTPAARDFVSSIHVRCLELLGTYMKSASSKSALVAMETARALLATKDGTKAWTLVEIYECKALMAPLRARRLQDPSSCLLPESYFDEVLAELSCDIDDAKRQNNWCWDERFWKSNSGFAPFIQRLVTGLIACCYGKSESSNSPSPQVKAESPFFSLCQKMCALEHDFAAAVFPGIVLNLLQNDITEMRKSPRPSAAVAGVALDEKHAGSTQTLANDRLSRAFASVLSSFVNQGHESDHQMVALIVATLEMLRQSSQTAFTTSRDHKPNTEPSTTSSMRASSQSKPTPEQFTTPPQWAGVPFGTVLTIDERLVAQACLRIKMATSALLYVDLYAEARFQGSGAILSRLVEEQDSSLQYQSTSSTKRSGPEKGGARPYQGDTASDAMSMIRLLKQSFQQLHESDNLRVIENHNSALLPADAMVDSKDFEFSASSLWELQQLDAQSRTDNNLTATSLKMATCLESLGLGNVLERYIDATVGDRDLWDKFTETDFSALREKWFEGQLHHGRWNENIWETAHILEAPVASNTLSLRDNMTRGFHEFTYESLLALFRDDVDLCRSSLDSARRALLQGSYNVFSSESMFAGLEKVIDQLRATNKIESFVVSQEPVEVLQQWGLQNCPNEPQNIFGFDSKLFPAADLTTRVREIVLRIFYARQPPHARVATDSLLVEHLWQCCASYRHQGRPEKADTALQHLRSILSQSNDVIPKLRIRLEDAMITESRGDFAGAIRNLKNLIKSLKSLQGQGSKADLVHECLVADSLAKCGSWMADYKTEPAKSILESYLLPASAYSNSIYETERSRRNATRATASLLSLAHLAAVLHESTLTRIRSSEWRSAGLIMQDRESEIRKCEPLVKEAELRHNKFQAPFRSKNQKNQSKEALVAERDFTDLYVYRERLRKELRFLTAEREKMERSVREHLERAVKSFGTALALAGTENSGVMHQHVFKMVSLWLANYNQTDDINNIMKEVFDTVPTFRFVPLTYQIFSRLGMVGEGPDMIFQELLQTLVFKMCDDHPYHCIVQLIALSNGMKVEVGPGLGTSERTASDYRNNVGDAKSSAAAELMTALERKGTAYVTQLVQSYQVLTDAYMHLAMASTTEFHQGARAKKPILISQVCGPKQRLDNCLRSGPKSLPHCPPCVLTKPPPLRPGCDYGEGREDPIGAERIDRFENSFTITETGINRPKVVMCIGSKGGKFRQLVKGQDDIRQDAIMQQVFKYVNDLMTDREKKGCLKPSKMLQNKLKLVTYHIVPLSPITGVSLQSRWVSLNLNILPI
jgi:hypothetical protein